MFGHHHQESTDPISDRQPLNADLRFKQVPIPSRPHPSIPNLPDLRWHIEQLLQETGLSNKALAERCNAHRDPHLGQGTPHVSADTIGRIRGVRHRRPRQNTPDPGFGVAYATVAHVYAVLRAQAHPVSPEAPVSTLMVRNFRLRGPSERVDDVLAYMGENEFSYSPYQGREERKRVWSSLARDCLQEVSDRGDGGARLRQVIDEVQGGKLITVQKEEPAGDLLARRAEWHLCFVLERRNPVGLVTPYDLKRVRD